ncbi:MAG: hypothetical protein KAH95_15710, partial [Spirochaetales bacterium]|nr:hypothetical protein [Spirochaetales bacterium]
MAKDHKFLDDINNRKMLFAHLVRSAIPKGSISSIKIPDMPKGYYSLTWKDIPGENRITVFTEDMPLLCNGSVQYEGEPILVICGPEEDEVLRLCSNTIVEYDTDYSLLTFDNYKESQISGTKKFTKGNVDSKFKDPGQTIEGEYRTSIQ